jgi:hypothetical protein
MLRRSNLLPDDRQEVFAALRLLFAWNPLQWITTIEANELRHSLASKD